MSPRFRYLSLLLGAASLFLSPPGHAQQVTTNAPGAILIPPAATNAPSSTLTSPTDAAKQMVGEAIKRMNANDPDGAMNDLTQALKLNPNNTLAHVLRGSLYTQKKEWPQAEEDLKTASQIDPTNVVLEFNVSEIKFIQKEYDAARPGFAKLDKNPDMGDYASYKVFLCDLFGGHEAAAKKELDAFNEAMDSPSYEFGNAAWDLTHKNLDDARTWLLRASRVYPLSKNNFYAKSLRDLGYLPIPGPNDVVTPPSGSAAHP